MRHHPPVEPYDPLKEEMCNGSPEHEGRPGGVGEPYRGGDEEQVELLIDETSSADGD